MTSTEDEEELDEAVEQYASDTTWSWVNHLHVNRLKTVHLDKHKVKDVQLVYSTHEGKTACFHACK